MCQDLVDYLSARINGEHSSIGGRMHAKRQRAGPADRDSAAFERRETTIDLEISGLLEFMVLQVAWAVSRGH